MESVNKSRIVDMQDGDEIHLSDYVAVVAENWRLIFAIAAFILLLGTVYAFVAKPAYRADVMIQVEDSANSTQNALGELASIFDTKQTADAEIELIRSRLVVGHTVEALHLDISAQPRYFPVIGGLAARIAGSQKLATPWFGMMRFAWGGEKIEVTRFEVPNDRYDAKYQLVARDDSHYELVNPEGDVVLKGTVGQLARGADQYGAVELVVARLRARPNTDFVLTRASTQATIKRLQDALVIAEKTKQSGVIGASLDGSDSVRTAAILNTLASTYVQQNIDRKSAEAEHTLAFLEQQLPQLRKQLDQSEDRYNAFRNQKGTVDLTEESRLLLQQIVEGKTKLVDLEQQRVEMAQRFTGEHPAVAALTAQIAALNAQQEQLNKRVLTLPDTEQSALRLLRDVRVNTELYTSLLDNAQQLRIVKAGQVGNVRVVDFAVAADEPVKPKRPLIIVLAALFGLVIGTVTAFAKHALFGGLKHSDEIEKAIDLPVYATIPHSQAQINLQQAMDRGLPGPHVLAALETEDLATEGIRSLRTALQFGLLDSTNNVIVITGPRPDVGKSFVSVNLSAVIASSGTRVLLIDADMRRGNVHSYLGVSKQPGLSDVITGFNLDDAIQRDVVTGVDLLPKGSLPPNPAELLLSDQFKRLLDEVSRRYDVVIIDTPPVLAVTDSTVIGRYAGATLLVVRHGQHPRAELVECANRLRGGGAALKGALLTDVPRHRFGYGSYYSGYYGYESVSE
ncbi:TPA: polysaccharide biosynthesis tyrosine autokinase [Burkholderia vietnamiensis]|uniref:Polysaccharide biosynthesis tyrosine autokinase n=1 Tax=Burkholderia vietnamiensis TaxID=60552 RepID=A0ABS1AVK0_BURVI|nr:polysaccharide biosynthesis tyrosine autokinase [Burkholderia vietnamiensis]KVE20946.1 protein tyrosine kinase [Burkholderia vietnamiensis]MBJ9688161.1 polysaccharide biosynthesis tyrosine autokinase [Burkholderia vietnamiensis]MDN8113589.1 polysaccharide biosynthesis tyrosine autokinase [Burkholderia vietnamiensis]HDR9063067.1 polysaccharide biosynthesis tyrosine autokinase [Burkholderia vietnamiensis]HDR9139463.1 polysaccharide biosynthesis tyrosine autokinase [Burkholderia vietnamiensis]